MVFHHCFKLSYLAVVDPRAMAVLTLWLSNLWNIVLVIIGTVVSAYGVNQSVSILTTVLGAKKN